MRRRVFRLRRNKATKHWMLHEDGQPTVVAFFRQKEKSEQAARHMCRQLSGKGPVQLYVYRLDGKIGRGNTSEASYKCNSKSPG